MLSLRLLGGLALEVDGEPLPAPGGRCASLLAWLALHPGLQPRSRVAARLWPEVLDESARGSLRTALLDLRRALAPHDAGHLQATRDEIGLWPPEQVRVDLHAFTAAVTEGRLQEALELAQGELLPELEHDWVYDAREAHDREVAQVLGQLASEAEGRGDLPAAIGYTHRLLALDPLAEEHNRALIRRLAAVPDRAAALAVYDRHRERLRAELGMAPSASTRELVEQIRSDVGTAGDPEEVLPLPVALTSHATRAMFGRAAELKLLTGLWGATAAGGDLRCVTLAGEPGIGKTRLVAELCRRAHSEGATVLYGRCHEDGAFPYAPFVEALRAYAAVTSPEHLQAVGGPRVDRIGMLVPQVAQWFLDDSTPTTLDPELEALRLFDAITSLLTGAARSAGMVLAIDDLHWADRPTLRLLDHLTHAATDASILLLGTYRDTELLDDHPLHATLARLRRERVLEQVAVRGLQEPEIAELVQASSSGTPPGELIHAVFAESEGNPYFAEELIRELGDVERDAVQPIADVLAGIGVPESIQDLIGRRLARLSATAGAIVAAAAVVGLEFDLEVLGHMTDTVGDPLIDALDEAVASRVIAELPGSAGRFVFEHALVRETLYGRLSSARRARLHGLAARAIEVRYADDLADHLAALARHHELAGDAARALDYHRLAGDAAWRVHATDDALDHYTRALEAAAHLGRRADDPAVYNLRHDRAAVRQRAGDISGAMEDSEAAVAGARDAGDAGREIAALNQSGGFIRRFHDAEGAVASHEAALRVAQQIGDARAQVSTLARLSIVYSSQLRLDEAVRLGEQALELADGAGDDDTIAMALDATKVSALQIGDLALLDAVTARLLELHERAGADWGLLGLDWVLLERAFLPIAGARWDEALRSVDEAVNANRRLRNRFAEPIFLDALCWLDRSRGEHERAIRYGSEAVRLAVSLDNPEWCAWTSATLGWAMLEAGHAGRAAEHLKRGIAAAEATGARAQLLRCAALLAWASCELGDRDRALALADTTEKLLADLSAPPGRTFLLGAHAPLAAARVRLREGAPERAQALVAPVLTAARESGWLETIAYALLLEGSCLLALGESKAGAALIEESLERAGDARLPWVEGEARARLRER